MMSRAAVAFALVFTVGACSSSSGSNGTIGGHGGSSTDRASSAGSTTASGGPGGVSAGQSSAGGLTAIAGSSSAAGTTVTGGGAAGSGGTSTKLTITGGTSAAGSTATGGTATSGSGGTTGTAGHGGGGATSAAGITSSGGAGAGASLSGGFTASGGTISGGNSGGTSGRGGSTGFSASYLIGADISFAESASSGSQDNLLSQLKAHGFNAIRLRTFVDPKAADGYDPTNGYCDIEHTVAFGKKVKSLGMFLYVDFHYSDNWADPGKQCVPVAWQKYTSITDLAGAVYDYTKDSISKLIAGGARPDMVQIGNETTPGMLMHVCDKDGLPTGNNKVSGSTSPNWNNLGALFKAGVKGVKDVDAGILTALHIDRGGDKATETAGGALSFSKSYIDNALKQGVAFDVFGESCYQQYQGDPNSAANTKKGWTSTLGGLAAAYPNIKILAAEYGPMQREINDVVFGLANDQGLGTFNWEPEKTGDWNTGHLLFSWDNDTFTAQPDLTLYDQMKTAYASRL